MGGGSLIGLTSSPEHGNVTYHRGEGGKRHCHWKKGARLLHHCWQIHFSSLQNGFKSRLTKRHKWSIVKHWSTRTGAAESFRQWMFSVTRFPIPSVRGNQVSSIPQCAEALPCSCFETNLRGDSLP